MYGLIADHVETHRPLSTSQWGFQAGKSTVTALLSTTHNILNLLEAGNEVCAVFFDFRKAFDSVPHRKLLDKLQELGLDERILQWVKSYLTDRSQKLVVNGESSDPTRFIWSTPGLCPWATSVFGLHRRCYGSPTFRSEPACTICR